MEQSVRRRLDLGGPLSRVIIPLAFGITRRAMLRAGVSSHERRIEGMLVHAYQAPGRPGSDPDLPVVLLHGIADSALTWAFTMRGLARVGPVYAIDLPGFGQSGYPPGRRYATIREHVAVVAAFIEAVVGRPALVVGNSMGGWIAGRLAELAPELVRGIVLIDPGGAMLAGEASWEPFVRTVTVSDLRSVRLIYRQMFGRVNPALYLGQRGFQNLFLRDAVRHFIESADLNDFFTPDDLRQIGVPAALVWGECDRFLPAGSFEFFRDNMPGARVLLLEGCGHLPQQERPRRVARFVREFAAALPGVARAP
ncbi:MAG TPA: alpha/beta fold hydrolase [Chloroflexaceae bacterium]|nr:alpha/beta fold hydrolase [Chloroflexaceae bacterium]